MVRTGLMALLLASSTLGEPTTGESSVEAVFTLEEVIVRPTHLQASPRTRGAVPDSEAEFTELEEVIVRPSKRRDG
ncbi:MAG: hypothetical protein H7Y22_13590 [Gemmatimonadaceae bacterium]|nr:hypothetical protein [Gloeobacterales cyanobacterium ES-bin-141]